MEQLQDSRQSGAIEVTPAMIEAGVDAYRDWDSKDDWSLERLVVSLYLKMQARTQRGFR